MSWDKLRVIAKEIRPYLRSVRREAIIAVVCSVGAVVTAIARPWPIKIVFDYALLPDQRVKWVYPYAMLKGYGAMGVVTFSCALLLAVSLLWALFSYIQRLMISTAGRRVTFQMRKRMFAHLQRLSLVYHRSQHMGACCCERPATST
jgi:ATP-binding cassette, subfamily B, bacterial